MVPLTEIFCFIDDFCKYFEQESKKALLSHPKRQRNRPCRMSLSEIMTIIILFHLSGYKTFKDFYINCIQKDYKKEFPKLLSYNRFIELMPSAFMPLVVFLHTLKGKETNKYFIDSTKLPVCHNLRINRNQVFKECAKRGKTSTGWFFGFKLHLIINNQGEIMSFTITPGHVHDVRVVEQLSKGLTGWLFADRGYISRNLSQSLMDKGLELITTLKSNMKKRILDPIKKQFLRKRNIIETINDQLKNILSIDHTRHRSPINFQINVLGGLVAYVLKPKKPSISFRKLNNLCLRLTSN